MLGTEARQIDSSTALAAPKATSPAETVLELSVVIPCLNESDTLGICLEKARMALSSNNINGEIIVADNGSTDGSQAIARRLGAHLVHVEEKGYGNALMGGIAAARGRFIIMGDADNSYNFAEIPVFLEKLRQGFALVQGCRLPSGGGRVLPGAMPWLHRWCGNPIFSFLARHMFHSHIHDIHCGMRGFTKVLYMRLKQHCTGMEFASEMIIKASLLKAEITEVAITLHPDGRKSHPPHLKTFRDGWRHLRFYLMYSPRWLFMIPGLFLLLFGLTGYALAMPRMVIGGVTFDVHTLLFSSLAILCGYQSIVFGTFTKAFAMREELIPKDGRIARLLDLVNLERGLIIALAALVLGLGLLATAANQWRLAGFGDLDYSYTMRFVIPGVTLTALGFQTVLASFFLSILALRHR
jgi:glycosyltransferase involved in cell wall biosynthesis